MSGLNLSAFDVIGPVMVGPSSSHTAGAARIGLIARRLLGATPHRARIGLHGSFAATGKGHATDRALVAGLLGESPDSASLPTALERAPAAGLVVEFSPLDLGDLAHPNTAQLELESPGRSLNLTAASLGGGVVVLLALDGHTVHCHCARPTLVSWHTDRAGYLAALTATLAYATVNITTISTTRKNRGGEALTVVEIDGVFPPSVMTIVAAMDGVSRVVILPGQP
jgi:L-serine dehydratase